MKEAISDVEAKKFTEFSKKVKTSLEDKLRNNSTVKNAKDEIEKLDAMKDLFAKISDKDVSRETSNEVPDNYSNSTED